MEDLLALEREPPVPSCKNKMNNQLTSETWIREAGVEGTHRGSQRRQTLQTVLSSAIMLGLLTFFAISHSLETGTQTQDFT